MNPLSSSPLEIKAESLNPALANNLLKCYYFKNNSGTKPIGKEKLYYEWICFYLDANRHCDRSFTLRTVRFSKKAVKDALRELDNEKGKNSVPGTLTQNGKQ